MRFVGEPAFLVPGFVNLLTLWRVGNILPGRTVSISIFMRPSLQGLGVGLLIFTFYEL